MEGLGDALELEGGGVVVVDTAHLPDFAFANGGDEVAVGEYIEAAYFEGKAFGGGQGFDAVVVGLVSESEWGEG